MAHARIIAAKRQAVIDRFGADGLAEVARALPPDVRAETVTALIGDTWVPERWVGLWQRAVWEGPAQKQRPLFEQFVRDMVDQGFGRVRRMLVKLASPALLVQRSAELWRDEHSHGTLTAQLEKGSGRLRLVDHPYTTSELAGVVMSESMRHVASQSLRAGSLEVGHALLPGALEVVLRWS